MMTFLFVLLDFQSIFGLVQTETPMSRSSRGALITKEDHRLDGHVIASLISSSFVSCAHACLAHSRCISTNYRVSSHSRKASCDLIDQGIASWSTDSILIKATGFVFSQYKHIKIETGCDKRPGCLNGGSCGLDETSGSFVCLCTNKWKGERCEQQKKENEETPSYRPTGGDVAPEMVFRFTNLRSSGRKGPTSVTDYQSTSLEGLVRVYQGLQSWLVPVTGLYQVEACGASGGNGMFAKKKGGVGAKVTGEVFFHQGTALTILVGQRGSSFGSGGGGTFLVLASSGNPLIIAGGGGGGDTVNGDPGQLGEDGSVNGGTAGGGGRVCGPRMNAMLKGFGGGGGWNESGLCYEGKNCFNVFCQDGGKSFTSGGFGGRNINDCMGGFGGGGTCGGGGGFSGGGVKFNKNINSFHSGGGGSFKRDSQWVVTQDCKRDHGYINFRILV